MMTKPLANTIYVFAEPARVQCGKELVMCKTRFGLKQWWLQEVTGANALYLQQAASRLHEVRVLAHLHFAVPEPRPGPLALNDDAYVARKAFKFATSLIARQLRNMAVATESRPGRVAAFLGPDDLCQPVLEWFRLLFSQLELLAGAAHTDVEVRGFLHDLIWPSMPWSARSWWS